MVKLDLDGFIFEFRVENYHKSSMANWEDEWCMVYVRFYSTDRAINYADYSESLLCCEVESLYVNLSELINGSLKENKHVEHIEPYYEYTCLPGDNFYSVEWVFNLWNNGALTSSSIHTMFGPDEVKELHEYLECVIEDD